MRKAATLFIMIIDYDKIRFFWEWFTSVSEELLKKGDNSAFIERIDHFITSLDERLDWEIGPVEGELALNYKAEQYLCISPCLNTDRLYLTKEIISYAPTHASWLFLSVKPAKGWIPRWTMLNELDKVIPIDSTHWKYVLYLFDDGTYDMDVWIDQVDGNSDTQLSAVEIAVTNLLGEERFMRSIKNIQLISDINDANKRWSKLENLKVHLDKLSEE